MKKDTLTIAVAQLVLSPLIAVFATWMPWDYLTLTAGFPKATLLQRLCVAWILAWIGWMITPSHRRINEPGPPPPDPTSQPPSHSTPAL